MYYRIKRYHFPNDKQSVIASRVYWRIVAIILSQALKAAVNLTEYFLLPGALIFYVSGTEKHISYITSAVCLPPDNGDFVQWTDNDMRHRFTDAAFFILQRASDGEMKRRQTEFCAMLMEKRLASSGLKRRTVGIIVLVLVAVSAVLYGIAMNDFINHPLVRLTEIFQSVPGGTSISD